MEWGGAKLVLGAVVPDVPTDSVTAVLGFFIVCLLTAIVALWREVQSARRARDAEAAGVRKAVVALEREVERRREARHRRGEVQDEEENGD